MWKPKPFARQGGLGHYNGTREEWQAAWRRARVRHRQGLEPDPKDKGLEWKASLIVERRNAEYGDPLNISLAGRLVAKQVIDEILAER